MVLTDFKKSSSQGLTKNFQNEFLNPSYYCLNVIDTHFEPLI
jgi:hypothetical protein